jgi:predicted component of type VI protein secretion system
MKSSQLKQIIKEEIQNVLNKNNTINEGWKENVLVGLASLAGSLGGIKAQDIAQNASSKDKIKTSYSSKSPYPVLIGYLTELSQAGGMNKTLEELGAITEAKMYLEALRDGQTPKSLSPAAKTVLNYAIKETKDLSVEELIRLSDKGENIRTASY